MDEPIRETSGGPEPRRPYWVVGLALLCLVGAVLGSALLLDRQLRPEVGIEPAPTLPGAAEPKGVSSGSATNSATGDAEYAGGDGAPFDQGWTNAAPADSGGPSRRGISLVAEGEAALKAAAQAKLLSAVWPTTKSKTAAAGRPVDGGYHTSVELCYDSTIRSGNGKLAAWGA
ncbi:MAG: hypothetical protein GEU73_08075 [Chloroflexi bacterium]|nr:hypothetical protein [Chloroflexota bacterium]